MAEALSHRQVVAWFSLKMSCQLHSAAGLLGYLPQWLVGISVLGIWESNLRLKQTFSYAEGRTTAGAVDQLHYSYTRP